MLAGVLQKRALAGAIERNLAGLGAALDADLSGRGEARPLRAALVTDCAGSGHGCSSPIMIGSMPRTDVYLKVELDLDPQESAERVAAEIARMLRKVYSVRNVEVSSIMPRETT
jgi:hypothetical protein